MIKKDSLIIFDPGEIAFHELPLMTTNAVQLGYTEKKKGNDLDLTIMIKYWMIDGMSEEILPVCLCHTEWHLETDGKLTVQDLYPICEKSVNQLRSYINQLAHVQGKPELNLHFSLTEHIRASLQQVVNIFLSNSN